MTYRLTNSAADRPPTGEQNRDQQTLEDLIVQAEIFMQYSLQAKVVERLEKIAELFPKEEERNERLRNLHRMANWRPAPSDGQKAEAKVVDQVRGAASRTPLNALEGAGQHQFGQFPC